MKSDILNITEPDFFNKTKPVTGDQAQLDEVLTKARSTFAVGDIVNIKSAGYVGKVIGYNDSLGGFSPGVRYPVLVKIIRNYTETNKDVVGSVFEYALDQLIKRRYYRIDSGHKALENGAHRPLSSMFDIAEVCDAIMITGHDYGQDYIEAPEDPTIEVMLTEFLTDRKLIYETVSGKEVDDEVEKLISIYGYMKSGQRKLASAL